MAHQTDVYVVHQSFKPERSTAKAVDPVCGMEMLESDSKNMIFRKDRTIFFCSRACKERFMDPTFKSKAA